MNIKDIKAGMLILFKARDEDERNKIKLALSDYDRTANMVFCRNVVRRSECKKYPHGPYIQLAENGSPNDNTICYLHAHELYVDCDAINNITKSESRMSDDGEFDDDVIIMNETVISHDVINAVNIFGDRKLGSDSILIIPNSAVENPSVKESLAELSKIYTEINELCTKARVEELDVMKEIVSRTFFSNLKYHDKEC